MCPFGAHFRPVQDVALAALRELEDSEKAAPEVETDVHSSRDSMYAKQQWSLTILAALRQLKYQA